MKSTVSEKGQVTIPKRLRDKLGIRPGTVLDFDEEEGRLVARKQSEVDVIRKWRGRGKLPGGMDVDAYLASSRE
jgi:AbrB family looped-hinge helix DNA binding protein